MARTYTSYAERNGLVRTTCGACGGPLLASPTDKRPRCWDHVHRDASGRVDEADVAAHQRVAIEDVDPDPGVL